MNKMTDVEFEDALKQTPCPECGEIGHLTTQKIQFNLTYKDFTVKAEGEGWICLGGCNQRFMSDDLTEQLANQTKSIDDEMRKPHISVYHETGDISSQSIH